MEIDFMLEEGAYAPEKAHKEDAGFDIKTPRFLIVRAHNSIFVDTGIHVDIPEGYVGMLKTKSGLNKKGGLSTEGVIDAAYRGSIGVKIYNHSDKDYCFDVGDKITQLVILPIPDVTMHEVNSFEGVTSRGNNGFGSTGR